MWWFLRRPEVKGFRLGPSVAGHNCFQVGQTLFNPLIESLEENTGQEPNSIRRAKIEWATPDSVDRFLQQFAHFSHAFQRSIGDARFVETPTTILSSPLSTQLRQPLGMGVAKAQPSLYGRRLAGTASLRLSLALLPTPLF
jgi:hypothetical protein